MSIVGILGSNLFSGVVNSFHGTQGAAAPKFEQIKEQFQQLGQDLQSGNLTQAQTDYATLSKEFPGANPAGTTAAATAAVATTAAPTAATTAAATTATTTTTPTTTGTASGAQQFAQLGQDLQSGNLHAAQQDYMNLQQTAQQNGAQQVGGHHRGHHHHGGGSEAASSTPATSQTNPISQAFGTLSQDLRAGNLSGAQSAFATLQNDLQQIGGFVSSGANSASPTSSASGSSTGGTLNVSA
jgi:outer membrane protein assembly factor BamD (BamD/ComL family)